MPGIPQRGIGIRVSTAGDRYHGRKFRKTESKEYARNCRKNIRIYDSRSRVLGGSLSCHNKYPRPYDPAYAEKYKIHGTKRTF